MNENESYSRAYADAGVDITAGYRAVELMKNHVLKTKRAGAIDSIGGFGGLFKPEVSSMKEPILVSGTDGVGTKLKLAFLTDRHDTVGIDCVAMCVNDIICSGAEPLFFLDYIACGKNIPEKIASIVSGVADGCVMAGCALIGGETAEHPGLMPDDEYDIAGFSVGIVDREKIVDTNSTKEGDVIIALPSSGVHSNGFSLIRKIFVGNYDLDKPLGKSEVSLGELLLTPTKIYVKPILALTRRIKVHGIAHITGGGFYENIPRAVPDGLCAVIKKSDVKTPYVFELIAECGGVSEHDMFNTYNMGVGMCVMVDKNDADLAMAILRECGEEPYIIGKIESASTKIKLI